MRTVEGRDRVRELCADLLEDESNMSGAWCELAAWPESIEETAGLVGRCSAEGLGITVSGGLTGIAGGALPEGGAVISTAMLRDIEMLDHRRVRAGAGVTLQQLRGFLKERAGGLFYPPDPTEETASVGGTVATDASGADSFLYGSTREWVDRITVVLADGSVLGLRRGDHRFDGMTIRHPELGVLTLPELERPQPPKNAAGYHIRPDMDLVDLFIGSEGTLGLMVEAELILAPEPAHLIDLAVFPASDPAFWELYLRLLHHGPRLRLRALEMMDPGCIRFLGRHPGEMPPPPDGAEFVLLLRAEAEDDDAMEETLTLLDGMLADCGVDPDGVWGGFEPSEHRKMKDFRHSLPESVNQRITELRRDFPGIHKFGSDGAVPPDRLEEYYRTCRGILEDLDLPHMVFGHAGQGHIHANAIPEDPGGLTRAEEAMREIAEAAVGMGGTISAEHGLGRLKLPYLGLMYSGEEIAGMERLRLGLDPGKVFAGAMDFSARGRSHGGQCS